MKKLIASIFISLDGFTVGPDEDISWVMDNFNDEMGKYASDLQNSMDCIVLGRVTYQIMKDFWPVHTEESAPGADKMNTTPKMVFSRTLDKVEWGKWNNATLVKDNVAGEIDKMKQQCEKDLVIYGSANLVQNLTRLGLIDEYQLLVHPVILGGGKPLFRNLDKPLNLNLLRTQSFKNGVVVLYYEPARA